MRWWQVLLLGSALLGTYFFIQALRNLAPGHPQSVWQIVLWSNIWAGSQNFSHAGRRYRNLSRLMLVVGIAAVIVSHLLR
jgi:hypothetical protein